jgi:very-short-patch-repair endonuclease
VRGKVRSEAELLQRAQSRESKGCSIASVYELQLAELLTTQGVQNITLQKAIGKYNVDLAWDSIAVEIYGGAWHNSGRHAGRFQERTHYILDSGYHLVIIWIIKSANFLLSPNAADYLIAFAESTRANPTLPSQYRVIRGTGDLLIQGCAQDNDFPMKLTRETGQQRITCEHLNAGIPY